MLTRIDLQHFKCFDELQLPLRPLTLLSGGNASGKSSVMQALVLLHQTMREHEWSSRLMLNGATISLGAAADVIDQVSGRRSCRITLHDGEADWFEWEFQGEREDLAMSIERVRGEAEGNSWDEDDPLLEYLLPEFPDGTVLALTDRLLDLSYLTAERLGPREIYQYDDPQLTPVVGPRGEHAVSIFHSSKEREVLSKLVRDNMPPILSRQVEAWMDHFFPGCALKVERVPGTNTITLGIRVSSDTEFHRPTHTGFGLTQVLPILVAALSAKKEGLLLIENPEVHLHPAAQAEMGLFLARTASAGVQVIIETHSDHVLNGIRRAVKEELLPCDDVSLLYFRPRSVAEKENLPQVENPVIDSKGNIDNWPSGFFDQFDTDINYFADWD